MNLDFPALSGGQAHGLNDAGVETFTGSVDPHLARECGQNTGDAKRPDAPSARIEFHRSTLPAGGIPAFRELRQALEASRRFWAGNEKEEAFFDAALAMAREASIPVLRVADYGTHGLTGGDTERRSRWYALVKSQGLSIKGDTAGGSFGIGKSSPFAASRLRTVFYGTRTVDGDVALQGVSRLVTHKNPSGRKTQGTGFIGDYDPEGDEGEPLFKAIRDASRIPHQLSRAEPGTDIWIIGYRSGPEWKDELLKSILTNFWPAIHSGELIFRVADVEVTKETCGGLIASYAGAEGFKAHLYYPAAERQPIVARLPHVGDCELRLATGSVDFPRKLCMARGSGMRIFEYTPRVCRVPFTGLFRCVDEEGNKILRQLEPPRHDAWEPGRIEGLDGKRALEAIKKWVRDEVRKLNPFFDGRSFNETELARYLPEELEGGAPEVQTGDEEAPEEGLEPRHNQGAAEVRVVGSTNIHVAPGSEPDMTGGEGSAGTDSDGHGEGSGSGDGAGTSGGDEEGGHRAVRLASRCFLAEGSDVYQLIIRADAPFAGSVAVLAVGEDGEREPVQVVSASPVGSDARLSTEGNRVGNVSVVPGEPTKLVIRVAAMSPRSLIAVGMR